MSVSVDGDARGCLSSELSARDFSARDAPAIELPSSHLGWDNGIFN